MKELKFEELTLKQKLGLTMTGFLNSWVYSEDNENFIFELIKERALGAVWIQQGARDDIKLLEKVKEIVDYPILIITDAESGMTDGYLVGRHSAIANAGDEKYAYAFGKVTGSIARKRGYNVVCNPLLDMNQSVRSLGTNKEKVTALATAECEGMHDGGVLTVGKHYPCGKNVHGLDSHMTEGIYYETKEEFIDYALYPYKKLMEKGLLDGIMSGHTRCVNIDNIRPASLSKPVIDIIRELGFDGFIITDALTMMGIRAKYTESEAYGYAIAAGNDTILPWTNDTRKAFDDFTEAYEKGLIPDEMLDAAVKRILATQHKVMMLPKETEISDEELEVFRRINTDGIFEKTDDGISPSISKDGNHFFAIMLDNDTKMGEGGKIDLATMVSNWYNPEDIEEKIKELFPNSKVEYFYEYPRAVHNMRLLENSIGCDEIIFITYSFFKCYCGPEEFTPRLLSVFKAMQMTNRITTHIHFGNPEPLKDVPHIPRNIIGGVAKESVETAIEVLAGNYEAKGIYHWEQKLN